MIATTMPDGESGTTRPLEENRSSSTATNGDDVEQLRDTLRAAERAYRAYLAELRQGDVEPVEDWSTWYAEYLLGLR
jgi:hypothetical protein